VDRSRERGGDRDGEENPSVPIPFPEPTTLVLPGSILAGICGIRKKLKK